MFSKSEGDPECDLFQDDLLRDMSDPIVEGKYLNFPEPMPPSNVPYHQRSWKPPRFTNRELEESLSKIRGWKAQMELARQAKVVL